MVRISFAFARLRWRLLRGSINHGGAEQAGAVLSTVGSAALGFGGGLAIAVAGHRVDYVSDLAVIFCTVVTVAVLGFGIVAGIAQPIDPRVIAAEPLTDRDRTLGLLVASAVGPPGLAGIMLGVGLAIGMTNGVGSLPIVLLAVISWLLALLLAARTATNLLALLASSHPRSSQVLVGVAGLGFYALFQLIPLLMRDITPGGRARLALVMSWTPPGMIGRALGLAGTDPLRAVGFLLAGSVWLVALIAGFTWSTRTLAVTVRRGGGSQANAGAPNAVVRLARRACGSGAAGAVAWRSLLTRFRTPRTMLETFTGAGVGLAAVLVPTLWRDDPGSGAVLVGGAVQLAVLFMAGNSFGIDGPPIAYEVLTGADTRTLVIGKARSIAIVAAPLGVAGPVLAASITAEWEYFVAGLGIGIGGLLAGTGAAVVQSAMVPIAMPESDNPFASGESGRGFVAALLLAVVLAGLALVTLPVALALFWAVSRSDTLLVTAYGLLTVLVGWFVLRAGVQIAVWRLRGRDPEFVEAVTPAR